MPPKKVLVVKESSKEKTKDISVNADDVEKDEKPIKQSIILKKKIINIPDLDIKEKHIENEKNDVIDKEESLKNKEESIKDKPPVKDKLSVKDKLPETEKVEKNKQHTKNKKISASKNVESSFDMFGDDDVDYRFVMMNYDYTKNKTLPKITQYEKALLIGKRAKQIEDGANPNIKVMPGQGAIAIAEEELRQRKIPFIIKRPIGNTFEYWKPADMEVNMD